MPTVAEFYSDAHIGSVFGYSEEYGPRFHHGQDIDGWATGTEIPTWAAGTVVRNAYNPDLGNYLVLDRRTTTGRYVGFSHMDGHSPLPLGEFVKFGGGVGPLGSTGDSTGPHLHNTVSDNPYPGTGPWYDPLPLIKAARTSSAGSGSKPIELEEEEDDMPKNTGIAWVKANGQQMCAVLNTGSGFYSEYTKQAVAYNGAVAAAFDTPEGVSWATVTESHAAAIKADLERVRKSA